ncbi:ABC transporter ATP-binding protein [Tardiphaga sp. 1201_B9_N1_1]|jgi:branched-chain amino acid transport system ATP-binding protein|uniref:ABC transporter ATP-binding protein n=1 Tax=Tardiphaga TaxID=1395974 RepID=UPI0008A7EFC0|nr:MULTISPECIES: ABC transporter ATP-binding protein [Tardiphaga]MDR6657765.1 branched-chain amino acid transport system ATP-binding protein [Tardiphaga robiniae]NUU45241.1 ABC transporter ATP-binding protein [Tardiphaga robiniae]UFS75004.1 ABC transporter ATP-binding protein [Tardiphaga sp. 37S4]SEH84439.1 amino acid/amide ABC transporter ATP-binding protein 2, HAAT family (TC 3.A.1.4.-) [Tardiphaga sp. OK245]SNT56560.1 amino acid/amide ABC transporter ATP-binding protein 2, HAAT family (TC 3
MSGHLTVENIFTAYDRADVLSGISIDVQPGKITCILGSNGAGKSTLIRSILRLTPPRAGSIAFEGKTLDQMATHEIVGLGIACIPEGRRIFAKMTVEENLRVGAYLVNAEKTVKARLGKVYEVFPRLKERAKQLAGTMSGGEQAMVSIGRGMMTDPKLLIIDEPSLGLSPLFVQENFNIVRRLNETGVTVLLVEQNVNQTLAIAHYGYVLSQGKIIVQGDSEMLAKNEEVQSAYFGGAH